MSLDVTLLRLLKTREQHDRLIRAVPESGIDDKTKVILADFTAYFKANPGIDVIDPGPFQTFFALRHPKLKSETLAVYAAQIAGIAKEAAPGTEDGIKERLVSVTTAGALMSLLEQFDNGEADLTSGLKNIVERHERHLNIERQYPKVRDKIEDILKHEADDAGFHWRLRCLNESMRPLVGGDFGIIGMRVDAGKTSFIASELSFMSKQVDIVYPGQGRNIIILNNEGPGSRIKKRLYNAVLELPTPELVKLSEQGVIYERYVQAQGGRDKLFVYNIHDYTMSQIEGVIRDTNPAIVVIDMLDNIPMDGAIANGGQRTDQILEAMYQRGRIWAVKYDCAVLATSQLSADADGECFPPLTHLSNSRTGKAGAAEFVIMGGMSHSEGLGNTRFISLPKNKKHRDGGKRDPRREVFFDQPRALFIDPTE